jgi:hypothetical protein
MNKKEMTEELEKIIHNLIEYLNGDHVNYPELTGDLIAALSLLADLEDWKNNSSSTRGMGPR